MASSLIIACSPSEQRSTRSPAASFCSMVSSSMSSLAPTALVITFRSGWRSISSELRMPSAHAAETHESSRVSWVSLPPRTR